MCVHYRTLRHIHGRFKSVSTVARNGRKVCSRQSLDFKWILIMCQRRGCAHTTDWRKRLISAKAGTERLCITLSSRVNLPIAGPHQLSISCWMERPAVFRHYSILRTALKSTSESGYARKQKSIVAVYLSDCFLFQLYAEVGTDSGKRKHVFCSTTRPEV